MKELQLPKPHIIIVTGIASSGKTTFAEKFADTFNAPFINAKKLGLSSENSMDLATEILEQVFKTKATVVFEGVKGTRKERAEIAAVSKKNGYEPLFVWVQTEPGTAHMRATKKTRTNPNPMTQEEFDRAFAGFTPLNATERHAVISGMHTYASQAKAILRRLSNDKGREKVPVNAEQRSQQKSANIVHPRRTGIVIR